MGTNLRLGSTIKCHAGSDPADVRKEEKLKEAGLPDLAKMEMNSKSEVKHKTQHEKISIHGIIDNQRQIYFSSSADLRKL